VPPKQSALEVFSVPQFRWLFFGNVAFFFAMQGQMLTRTLLAWELTGEATALAYINLVVAVPLIIASVLGGASTDRVERRRLVMIGQSLITANEVFILILLFTGHLEFWHMLCTAFVSGCAFPFIMPARMAITMKLVGPKRLQSAMGFQSGAMNLNRILGPAVMGLIIAQFSFTAAYVLSIMLYGIAILCMLGIQRSRSDESGAKPKPLLQDIGAGFSYIRGNRPVLICLMFGLLPMFLAMPFQNILVMLAEQSWGAGESGVGILMATGGVGGVLGAIWVVKARRRQAPPETDAGQHPGLRYISWRVYPDPEFLPGATATAGSQPVRQRQPDRQQCLYPVTGQRCHARTHEQLHDAVLRTHPNRRIPYGHRRRPLRRRPRHSRRLGNIGNARSGFLFHQQHFAATGSFGCNRDR
jgi:MFS family permease